MLPTFRRSTFLALTFVLAACGSVQPYQGMNSAQLFAHAQAEYEAEDWDEAIRALDRLFLSYAGFGQAAEARIMLADANFAKEDYLTAQAEYVRFLDRHPSHPEAPRAALGICKSLSALSPIPQRDQTYTQDAQSVCRNVIIDYAGTSSAVEAAEIALEMRLKMAEKEFLNAEFYYSRDLYDSAIKYYGFVADLYPETEWAPRALLGIYRANLEIGYEDLAGDARRRLLEEYPESVSAREVSTDVNGGG